MNRFTYKRLFRQPLPALGVLLFCAILTVALCTLHQSKLEAKEHYDEIYHDIDVTCTLTNLTGTESQGLEIANITLDRFTGHLGLVNFPLWEFLKNVQVRSVQHFRLNSEEYIISGITSINIAPELWSDNGCTVEWLEGYDESIYSGSEMVCVVSQELYQELVTHEIAVYILSDPQNSYPNAVQHDFSGSFTIVGVANGVEKNVIFCPWNTLMDIWQFMGQYETASALHGTLKNNNDLEVFRALVAAYYPVPNPNADYSDLRLAMDIDDSQLKQAELTLQNNLRSNEFSRILIFGLTTAAGFIIGFLMIRSRKWEIALMRTLGMSNIDIFNVYSLEQTVCAALGAVLGGASYHWQPAWQLGVFVGVYFVGLSLALLVILRNNLLMELKQKW